MFATYWVKSVDKIFISKIRFNLRNYKKNQNIFFLWEIPAGGKCICCQVSPKGLMKLSVFNLLMIATYRFTKQAVRLSSL